MSNGQKILSSYKHDLTKDIINSTTNGEIVILHKDIIYRMYTLYNFAYTAF
jgi:hypothetical protein